MEIVRVKHRKGESEEDFELRRATARSQDPAARSQDPEPKGRKAPTPRSTSQKDAIAALLSIPNALLLIFPATRDDALTEPEQEQLVTALDHYQQKDERARRGLHKLLAASTIAELLSVLLILALPRLAAHGLIPASVGKHLEGLAGDTLPQQPADVTPSWANKQNGYTPSPAPAHVDA